MTMVTGKIVDSAGVPVSGAYVYAWLSAVTFARVDGARVLERTDTFTRPDGTWSLDLPAASVMVDPGAVWLIREVGYDQYTVSVPDLGPVGAWSITTSPPDPTQGHGQFGLGNLADVDTSGAATDQPLMWRRGTDGVYRLEPAAGLRPRWTASDDIRVATSPPTDEAPIGAVHLDVAGGRAYRNGAP